MDPPNPLDANANNSYARGKSLINKAYLRRHTPLGVSVDLPYPRWGMYFLKLYINQRVMWGIHKEIFLKSSPCNRHANFFYLYKSMT